MNRSLLDVTQKCLQLVAFGLTRLEQGDYAAANRAFAAAFLTTHALEPDDTSDLRALVLYNVSRLRSREKRMDEACRIREQAAILLSGTGETAPLPQPWVRLFYVMMSEVLAEIGEYRRAIPYCEAALQGALDFLDDPAATATALRRAGQCYVKIGLRDHAAVPLRAAVQCFRTLAGDPRLPAVLLDLGNALRKSCPAEAERCYQEAADFHESRGQLESAAPAWVNLGVLCSEQGRYDESLAYYEKALHVRERLSVAPERMGTLLNNIANVRRRMGQFPEALTSVDRALELLEPPGGNSLACAYRTRGLIYRDWGRDADSVQWFRKSAAEHQRQPSPNLETLSEELQNEAAALERLARHEEAAAARSRLESVRETMAAVLPVGAISQPKSSDEGAVLIELAFGGRQRALTGAACEALERRLAEALEAEETGYCGGRVVIPETTTLLFYGPDAEAMFRALDPVLRADPLCAGARVTVRQLSQHREVFLAGTVM